MTMPQSFIGVDVAKDWIDVFDPHTGGHRRHPMTPAGLGAFSRQARGSQVIFEASGGYDRPLAQALTRAGVRYTRVNPRQAREFARASGRLAKTDRVDAAVLARMGAALRPEPSRPHSPNRQRLSDLLARKRDLTLAIGQERNRAGQGRDAWIRRQIDAHLRLLARQRLAVEREIRAAIAADPELAALAARLRSVPGIGPHTAAVVIARLPEIGTLDRRRIAALGGLAPQAADSGARRGARRVWGGRPELRRALFIAGLAASRYDPAFAAFRARLEAAGKPKKVAIIAVARKLLTVLNVMIRDGTEFRQTA